MVTRERFLFFLNNSAGQCYYVDISGRVLTCQSNDSRAWLPQAPDGWRDQQLGFGRNMHYWAMNRTYSTALKFVGDGATIIRWLLYTQKGVDTNLYLNINKYNDANDIHETYYKGEVDLMNNVKDDPLVGITCNVIEGGILKLIKAYENTPFEIPVDGSLLENIEVNINGLIFNANLQYSLVPVVIAAHGIIVPLVFQSKVGCDAGVISSDQQLTNFDPNNGGAINQLISESTQYCFTYDKLVTVTIQGNLFFTGSCNNGALFAYTSLSNVNNPAGQYQPINLINTATRASGTSAIVASGAIASGTTYTINQSIQLQAGESLFIMMVVEDSSFTLSINPTPLILTFDSQFTDSTVIGIKPLDLVTYIIKKICNQAYSYPESNAPFAIQSDLLNQHANLVLTSGAALRKEANAVIKTSLSEFFDAFDTLLGASLGNLYTVGTAHGETLFIEKLGYVLDSSQMPFDLGEVSKLKVTPAIDLYFDMISIGYPEQKYDEQQGNYEWNTTSKYKAPIHKLNKEYKKVSPYRGDAYGIEYTRTLVSTSNSTNNKSDNNTFILNVDYSQIQAAQASVIGTPGTYYGSGYFLPDANSGTNRGQFMAMQNITGSGIASDLSIISKNTAADTLQYIGNGDTVNLIANIKFQFEPGLSWHYGNVGFIFNKKYKNLIDNGTYYATFELLFNDLVIFSQPLTLSTGASETFNIAAPILNKVIKNADAFQFQIKYSTNAPNVKGDTGTGSDSDGYLLVFSIQSFTISVSNDNATPVYSLLKKDYSATSFPTLEQGQSLYNVEEMSPRRLLDVHGSYIKSVLYNRLKDILYFQSGDKNTAFSTTLNGVTVSEGTSLPIGSIAGSPLFYPFYFEFETQVPLTFMELFGSTANTLLKFEYVGNTFYGFPMDVKVKPALNDTQQWKVLCSPLTDLSQLVGMEYDSINNLELMANGTAISKTMPIRLVPMGYVPPAQYNFIHIDQAWFIQQVQFYVSKDNYYHKWQNNDTWNLQLRTVELGPVVGQVVDNMGNPVASFNFSQKTDPSVVSPYTLWEAQYALTSLSEGIYYLLVTSGTGNTTTVFISEGHYVKPIWKNTLLFEYTSKNNDQGIVFSTGYSPCFRVEGWLGEYMPKANFTEYEDQEADLQMLNAIPFMTKTLYIGKDKGVPPWVINLIDRILYLNTVKIDGVAHTREKDSNWEKVDISNYPMKNYKITIREKLNSDFITLTTDGQLNSELLVAYNIDTAAFGDGSGGSNVVQVTEVNG